MPLGKQGRVWLDMTFNLGHIASLVTTTALITGFYFGLDKRVSSIEEMKKVGDAARIEKDASFQRSLDGLTLRVDQVKVSIDGVSQQIAVNAEVARRMAEQAASTRK